MILKGLFSLCLGSSLFAFGSDSPQTVFERAHAATNIFDSSSPAVMVTIKSDDGKYSATRATSGEKTREEIAGPDTHETLLSIAKVAWSLPKSEHLDLKATQIKDVLHSLVIADPKPATVEFENKKVKSGSYSLDCARFQTKSSSPVFTTVCLLGDAIAYYVTPGAGWDVEVQRYKSFHGKLTAGEFKVVSFNGSTLLHGTIEARDLKPEEEAALFTPSAEMKLAMPKGSTCLTVTGGRLTHRVQPDYPPAAKLQRHEGEVVILATIGKDGVVKDPQIAFASWPELGDAAIEAVRKWKYETYLLCGEPVTVDTTIHVNFHTGNAAIY
jgi:TonB family protein